MSTPSTNPTVEQFVADAEGLIDRSDITERALCRLLDIIDEVNDCDVHPYDEHDRDELVDHDIVSELDGRDEVALCDVWKATFGQRGYTYSIGNAMQIISDMCTELRNAAVARSSAPKRVGGEG